MVALVLFEKLTCLVTVAGTQSVVAVAVAVVVSFFVEILAGFLEDMSDHYAAVDYASDSLKKR